MTERQYNPLDKLNLGKSVAEALLDSPVHPLGSIPQFDGAGIYVIYYKGPFPPYRILAERNATKPEWPIYIGKAIPPGGRKGVAVFREASGPHLWGRLREHADSIRAASNLAIEDFDCRHLIVDDIWIPLGETLLIATFKPVWNISLGGFGNHDPGKGRYQGLQPLWDVLHPGRDWALRCRQRSETPDLLAKNVESFLRANRPPTDPHLRFSPAPEAPLSLDDLDL